MMIDKYNGFVSDNRWDSYKARMERRDMRKEDMKKLQEDKQIKENEKKEKELEIQISNVLDDIDEVFA